MSQNNFHGSDLERIEELYDVDKDSIINYAANVNPLGISPKLRKSLTEHIDAITSYPDREYSSLRKCIAQYANTSEDKILVGNGTTELISLFIQILEPKKALILGPTYSEYEREISLGGGSSKYYPLKETNDFVLDYDNFSLKLEENYDMLILCNPNNPTSSLIKKETMRNILDTCKENDIFVMVDETYIEFVENVEKTTAIPLTEYYNNIVILRSTSKFFASPGLRLGYAITGNMNLIHKINQCKNPWMINSLAAIAGELMFEDKEYINKTNELIVEERNRVYNILKASKKYKVYKPNCNFILLRILDDEITSDIIFEKAIKNGMMIRDCSTFPFLNDKYIRFCFMSKEDNDKLIEILL